MIVALSETRLVVCFFSLNVRLQQVILVGKKKQVAKIFPRFGRKVCKTTKAMAMNKEDTHGFHTTFRDLVWCTSQWNPIHLNNL